MSQKLIIMNASSDYPSPTQLLLIISPSICGSQRIKYIIIRYITEKLMKEDRLNVTNKNTVKAQKSRFCAQKSHTI
jgi:hypothetical protein